MLAVNGRIEISQYIEIGHIIYYIIWIYLIYVLLSSTSKRGVLRSFEGKALTHEEILFYSEISVTRTWCIQQLRPCFLIVSCLNIHQSSINQPEFRSIQDRQLDHPIISREVFPSHGGFLDVAVYNATGLSQTKGVRRRFIFCGVETSEMEVVSCCFKAATTRKHLKTEVWKNTMNENLNPTGPWTHLPH